VEDVACPVDDMKDNGLFQVRVLRSQGMDLEKGSGYEMMGVSTTLWGPRGDVDACDMAFGH
jgi:hypothetical protein